MKLKRSLLVFIVLLVAVQAIVSASAYRSIDTVHTRIIFSEPDAVYAQIVASFADEVYEQLALFLENFEDRRVPVIISGNPAWANGYFTTFPSAIVLYTTSPDDRFIGSRTVDWLKSLYTHEMTHFLHLTKHVGPARLLRFLGPEVTSLSTVFMPGWWVEGISTYAESTFSAGGRGDSLPFGLTYQVPIAQDRMWSLGQGAYASALTPANRIYSTGYLLVDYLIETYQSHAFSEINRRFAAFPFFGMNPAFRKVTSHSATELFALAVQHNQTLAKEPENSTYFTLPQQGNTYLPAQSEAAMIGYASSPSKGSALVRYDQNGRQEQIIPLSLVDHSSLAVAKDKVLFAYLYADPTDARSLSDASVGYSDLYLLDLDTMDIRQCTSASRLVHPAISSDGKRAAASQINGPFYDLVEVDLASGTLRLIAQGEETSYLESSLNADGSLLATIALHQGNTSLVVFDRLNNPKILVGPTSAALHMPLFTEDGSLLFVDESSVYRYEWESGRCLRLFTDPYGIFAARIIKEDLIYESYSSEGVVLKHVPVSALDDEPAAFAPALGAPDPYVLQDFPTSGYADALRLNLVLPFPFIDANHFQPGVWMHMTSLLKRHSLVGMAGWSLAANRMVADLTYQYAPGNFGLQLLAQLNQYNAVSQSYEQQLSLTIGVPLVYHVSPRSISRIDIQPSLSTIWSGSDGYLTGNLTLGTILQKQDRRSSDFFGGSYASLSLGLQAGMPFTIDTLYLYSYASLSAQLRLGSSSAMIRFNADVLDAFNTSVAANLPLFSFLPQKTGSTKFRLKSSLRLPLGLLDLPFLAGGWTGLGLELSAQGAWYLESGVIVGEGAWALQAKLTGQYVLGGPTFSFRPFVAYDYLVGLGSWLVTLGIDGTSLLNFYETV
ncbi:MAG: hypothetical protein AB7C91_07295 [Sphaerochaeta sp.]|uniref:hypothetical protein n=1 Tax=Sphaerochaeta sp. TaxID=1972642 RepID=UPI003D0F5C08